MVEDIWFKQFASTPWSYPVYCIGCGKVYVACSTALCGCVVWQLILSIPRLDHACANPFSPSHPLQLCLPSPSTLTYPAPPRPTLHNSHPCPCPPSSPPKPPFTVHPPSFSPGAPASSINFYLHTPYPINPNFPPAGLSLLFSYLQCISPTPPVILNNAHHQETYQLHPAIVVPLVAIPGSDHAQALQIASSRNAALRVPARFHTCLSQYTWSEGVVGGAVSGGIN